MAKNQAPTSEQKIPNITKLRIIKNLVLISLSFFLLFTAYDGLSMLQNTMNKKDGIGVISQAVGYISFCISALLLPKYVIKKLGCKSSLFASIILYIPFIAANFYPKWYIMIPTGVLAGMGASVLWGSQCTYFNESAVQYTKLIKEGSLYANQSPDISSNRTSVEILSQRNSKCEIIEENSSEDDQPVKDKLKGTSKDSVVRHQCKNPSCRNVEEFVVSEITKHCVQFQKNTININNAILTGEERKFDNLENLQQTYISFSPAHTHEIEREITRKDVQGVRMSKVEKIVERELVDSVESVSPQRNQDYRLIFQKANTLESVTGLVFGCHGIAYYSSQICSYMISYYVLKGDDISGMRFFRGCPCGAHFCNDNYRCINYNTEYVRQENRNLLTGICLIIASISVLLVFFFVDPLKKEKTEDVPENTSFRLVSATFRHNKKKEQLCLIPISFFEGMLQGFYTADFTKSYVGGAWSASNGGFVSLFYGSACVIASSASGFLVKYSGRMLLILIGQVIGISIVIYLLLWKPDSDLPYKFYIASIFFGTLTGIYWSQLLAFYGLLFKKDEEAAFASYYLWSSLGWTTSFLLSGHLCTYVKIYVLLTLSIIGTTGYLFAERSYGLRKQQAVAST